jgi:acyl carrier protein
VGVAGELYIGGAGVARGYLNRAELTAERFIASPFVEGERLYKTGDVGRYLADGNIEFLGRNDDQVKIRGFRIELGEIEARLSSHAGVAEATVVAREDGEGGKRLVAYYTEAGSGEGVSVSKLRTYLSESLPEYMVPSAYVQMTAFPLTPNGKLDRRALPAPEWTSQDYEAPEGELEQAAAAAYAEVLGMDLWRIGRNDNFFELGGNSLSAMRLMNRLQERLGIELALRNLFEQPTVAGAAQVAQRQKGPSSPDVQTMPSRLGLVNEIDSLSDEEVETMLANLQRDTAR